MRSKVGSPAVLLAILCICLSALPARAQTATSATVSGIVRDSSGLMTPGVAVSIRNHATNPVWETVSDERGRFRILYLPVGDYHLSAQLSGFTTANVNLALAVGGPHHRPDALKAPPPRGAVT